jgi:hypothetical protein
VVLVIDERFSSFAFDSLGVDSNEAGALAVLLAEEVRKEMHHVIERHFADVIKRLNSMGHNLKPEVITPGEIAYRDDSEDERGYHCKLRVALDIIVSTGYAHLNPIDDGDK